jgi:uncharacterized membrane protein YfcA
MMRPTSLLLNVVAAGYTTWRLHRAGAIGSLAGAAVGTAIGLRWVSPRMIRVVLAAILLASGLRVFAG